MSVLDDVVKEASGVIPKPGEDNEEMQREAYTKMYAVEPLPAELEGKPYLSLFIKHNDIPIKHAYIANSNELRDFIVEFWSDLHGVEDNIENYTVEYRDYTVPMRSHFQDADKLINYICRHLLSNNQFWKEELRMEGDKEILRKLSEESHIIYEPAKYTFPTMLFLDWEMLCKPNYKLNLTEVYENLIRKSTVGPYNISYNIGSGIVEDYVCETIKDVFDFIFIELGFALDSSWDEVIAHVRYGRSLPREEGPHWFERLYRK